MWKIITIRGDGNNPTGDRLRGFLNKNKVINFAILNTRENEIDIIYKVNE